MTVNNLDIYFFGRIVSDFLFICHSERLRASGPKLKLGDTGYTVYFTKYLSDFRPGNRPYRSCDLQEDGQDNMGLGVQL